LSTPPEEPAEGEGGRARRIAIALRALALGAALLSMLVLWTGERVTVPHDLQLVSEAIVRPGDTVALRAFVLRDVEAPEGPTLARVAVPVRLLDLAGRELAKTVLSDTVVEAMEGAIRIPDTARGTFVLEATAQLAGSLPLRCQRTIEVSPTARPLPLHGRTAGPLQQLALGATQRRGLAAPPDRLLPRVLGGACVPEQRCTIMVWVGEPAAAIVVRPNPAISVVGLPLPSTETSGLVELTIRVHGPEANLVLEARRGNEPVGERAMRLPIGLGDVAIAVERTVLEEAELQPRPRPGARISLALPPGREHALLDVYSDGHLRQSLTCASVVAEQPLGSCVAGLPLGLSRLQARVDRFSADGAGARMVYVRRPGESDLDLLRAFGNEVARGGPAGAADEWPATPPAWVASDFQRAAAFILAPLETLRAPVPAAASGRPTQLARVDQARRLARFGVSSLLVLAALFVGVSLMRRGIHASAEASAILAEAAGETSGEQGDSPRWDTLKVIALALSVVLAFLAAALLIASKSLWF
jgi:hypothetical protein